MFMGEYNHTVDAKGRLIVPSKFREPLGEDFVVPRGLDGLLSGAASDQWTAPQPRLPARPYTPPPARNPPRFLVASAATCEVDKQGRILLPAALREYAGIEKDAVLVGMGSRIEIWSREAWTAKNDFSDIEEIAEDLGGLL